MSKIISDIYECKLVEPYDTNPILKEYNVLKEEYILSRFFVFCVNNSKRVEYIRVRNNNFDLCYGQGEVDIQEAKVGFKYISDIPVDPNLLLKILKTYDYFL